MNYTCCVCGHVLEEREAGLKPEKSTNAKTLIYRKLYSYFCPECNCFRQAKDE